MSRLRLTRSADASEFDGISDFSRSRAAFTKLKVREHTKYALDNLGIRQTRTGIAGLADLALGIDSERDVDRACQLGVLEGACDVALT